MLRKRGVILLGVLAVTALLPLTSVAQSGTTPCPLPSDPAVLVSIVWPLLDTNSDGSVSPAELSALIPGSFVSYLSYVDANGNGSVEQAEILAILPLVQMYLGVNLLSFVDVNGNGLIEYSEVAQYATQAQFAALDINGNGVIDCGDLGGTPPVEGELEGSSDGEGDPPVDPPVACPLPNDPAVLVRALFPVVDTDGDGGISWAEVNAIVPLSDSELQYFNMLDSNKDGVVSLSELTPFLPLLQSLLGADLVSYADLNGDGVIQYEEISEYATPAQFALLDKNGNGVLDCGDVGEQPLPGQARLVLNLMPAQGGVVTVSAASNTATGSTSAFVYLVPVGTAVAVAVQPNPGWEIAGVDGLQAAATDAAMTFTIVMDSDKVVTIRFRPLDGTEGQVDPPEFCPLPNDPIVLLRALLPVVDTDGDGGLSWAEVNALVALSDSERQYFDMLDMNHDGVVTLAEISPYISLLPALLGSADLIGYVDVNGDGVIQFEEVSAYATEAQFALLDTNSNGVIDCGDVGALPPVEGEPEGDPSVTPCPLPLDPRILLEAVYPFVDMDGSGGISWAEIENLLSGLVFIAIYPGPLDMIEPYFAMADLNHNGEVSIDELLAVVMPLIGGDLLGLIDTNGDGVISLNETGGYVPADIFAMLDANGNGVIDCGDLGTILPGNQQRRLVLNVMPPNGGAVTLSPVGMTATQLANAASIYLYPVNTVVTIAAVPNPGWVLAGIDGLNAVPASGAVMTYSLVMNSDKAVNVRFRLEGEPEGDPDVTPCPLPLDARVLLEAVYPFVDTDGSGGISMAEIQALLAQFPYVITIYPSLFDEIEPYFTMADADGNGEVTIDELLAVVLPLIGGDLLGLIDTNGDGVISPNELGGYVPATLFAMLDANGNGVIDCGDLGGYVDPDPDPVCPIALDPMKLVRLVMPVLDPDGDGAVAIADIQALIPQVDVSVLAMLDRNNDGLLTLDDISAFLPMIQQILLPEIDPNRDGVIAYDEVSAYVTQEQFALVDTNGDGVLDCYDIPDVTPPPMDPCMIVRPLLDRWTALDVNNDGALSLEEMHALAGGTMMMIGADGTISSGANMFALLDENGDGLLQQQELARFNCTPIIVPGQYCPLMQEPAKLAALLIGLADTDGDGQLSEAEFDAVVPELPLMTILPLLSTVCMDADGSVTSILPMPDPFDMLDRNGDGKLSNGEVVAVLGQAMALVDTNGDGAVSLEEFNATLAPFGIDAAAFFGMLDQNDNGVLDCGDYGSVIPDPDPDPDPVVDRCAIARQLLGIWNALDANGDGSITRDELVIVLNGAGLLDVTIGGWGAMDLFSVLDIDGSGAIERAEAQGIVDACDGSVIDNPNFGQILPMLEALFNQIDTNGDGGLSLDEISAIYPIPEAVFAQLDLNGDGVLSLADLQDTTGEVTDPVDPTEPVDPDSVLTLTCSAMGNGMYTPGQPMAIAMVIDKSNDADLTALGLRLTLPAGWALVEAANVGAVASPAAGDTGAVEWAWAQLPAFPLRVVARVAVSADAAGPQTLTVEALYRVGTGTELSTGVVSVIVPQGYGQERTHSADLNHDWSINLTEILRVVQFFNVRGYHCGNGSEDGFLPGAGDTTCGAHSSDFAPRDGVINLSELLRLVQMFNVPSRAYYVLDTTDDGFAPGGFSWSFTSK